MACARQAQPVPARRGPAHRRLSPAPDGIPVHRPLRRDPLLAAARRRDRARRRAAWRSRRIGPHHPGSAETRGAGRTRRPGVAIEVQKRLPMQGGVGGGSSDAATVLVALNELWDLGLQKSEIAASSASNLVLTCRFSFTDMRPGPRVSASNSPPMDFPEPVFLLVQPDATVSTAEVFKDPELTRDSPTIKIRDFLTMGGRNDCEPVVRRRFPVVAEALDWLGGSGRRGLRARAPAYSQ